MAINPELRELAEGYVEASASLPSASITGVNDHLYLAHITTGKAAGSTPSVSSIAGLGLTWTLIKAQCGGRNTLRSEVWYAIGAATTGAVTATLSAAADEAEIHVSRWSDVLVGGPIGASSKYNTNGSGGACSGGVDTDDAIGAITTTVANSVVVNAVAYDVSGSYSITSLWTSIESNSVGDAVIATSIESIVARAAGAVAVGASNNIDTASDWALVTVEIIPRIASSAMEAAAMLEDVELYLLPPDLVFDDSSARCEGDVLEIKLTKAALSQHTLEVKARLGTPVCTRSYSGTTAQAANWAGWVLALYVRQELVFEGPIEAAHVVWAGSMQPGNTYDAPGSHVVLTALDWFPALARRRVVETSTGGTYSYTETPNRIFADLVRTNMRASTIVTPTGWQTASETRDQFTPWTVDMAIPAAAGTSTTYKADCGENLLDVLLELCNSAASDADWLWPTWTRSGTTITFSLLRGRSGGSRGIGSDLTTAASGMVGGGPFSAERGNIVAYEKLVDRTSMENHYTGTGQGRGAGMRRRYKANTSSMTTNGIYEGWGPVPSASTNGEIDHELQRLINERATGHVQHVLKVIEIPGAVWPTHFDLADSLPVYTPLGETLALVATGLVWTLVAPGPARLELDLGNWPALVERQLGRSGGGGGGGGGRGGGGRPRSKAGESATDPDTILTYKTISGQSGGPATADVYNDNLDFAGYDTGDYVRIKTYITDDPETVKDEVIATVTACSDFTANRYIKVKDAAGGSVYVPASTAAPGP